MMEIKDIVQTCEACPSQWEAKTQDGRGVYIRYRFGGLSIYVSDKPNQHGLNGKCVYSKSLGDEYDGVISLGKILPIINRLDTPQEEPPEKE
jgi:hypothetical protein